MKNMNIVYPPLVEQMYKFMHKLDKPLTKQDVYKKAIEFNMIDQQGNPTQWALDNGYISEARTPQEAHSINPVEVERTAGTDLDNVFRRMPSTAFSWVEKENQYAIDCKELKKAILSAAKDGSLSPVGRKHWLEVLADINSRKD